MSSSKRAHRRRVKRIKKELDAYVIKLPRQLGKLGGLIRKWCDELETRYRVYAEYAPGPNYRTEPGFVHGTTH